MAILAAFVLPAAAQAPLEVVLEAQLHPTGPPASARFGYGVAVDGTRAMVSAREAIYFYEHDGSAWVLDEKIHVNAMSSPELAVALHGNTAVAGERGSNSAFVFRYGTNGWVLQQTIEPADGAGGDDFGWSVSVHDGTIVVGSPGDDHGSPGGWLLDAGAVYVFGFQGGSWVQQKKVIAADGETYDHLGWALDLDGEHLIAGAYGHEVAGVESGAAYVYQRGGGWPLVAQLVPPDPLTNGVFGTAVSISGSRAVVGDQSHAPHGKAFVFEDDGTAWSLAATLVGASNDPIVGFGSEVELDGQVVAVGDLSGYSGVGQLFVFREESGAWVQQAQVPTPGGSSASDFASSLALSGGWLFAGAPRYTDTASLEGTAFVFALGPPDAIGTRYCFGTGCPCGNDAADNGCANSSGMGGDARAYGSLSVADDELWIGAANLLAGQPALLFVGTTQVNGGNGISFGDGLRCAGGTVVRLGVEVPDGAGACWWGPDLGQAGGWGAGDTRYFQVWYRDPTGAPCASGFNLTNGLQLGFGA